MSQTLAIKACLLGNMMMFMTVVEIIKVISYKELHTKLRFDLSKFQACLSKEEYLQTQTIRSR